MKAKMFEIRDRGTFIPILAVLMEGGSRAERYLIDRAGYRSSGIVALIQVVGGQGEANCCPDDWAGRTYPQAHLYIERNWDYLTSGDVIDVEFILGETTERKVSERCS